MTSKKCKGCLKVKPLTEYHVQSHRKDGRHSWCKLCRSSTGVKCSGAGGNLMKKLGMKRPPLGTPCDNCGKTESKLFFDHCHEKNIFRGWLCQECNTGIAKLGDTLESLERTVNYLKKSELK